MLYDGPNAVTVINMLAVLAAATDDPSLITPKMPREAYVRLTTPGSFRASLYQVASNMCGAFRKADYSMGTIKSLLIDMPDYIQDALQGIAEDNDKRNLNRVVTKMGNVSIKCKTAAEEAKKAFDNVLEDLQELIKGALATKSQSEGNSREAVKNLEEYKIKKEQRRLELEEQKQQQEELKELVKKASEDYCKSMEPLDVDKMIGLTLMDVGKDMLTSLASAPGKVGDFLKGLPGINSIASDPNHKQNKSELDVVILEELDDLLDKIDSNVSDKDHPPSKKDVDDWVNELNLIEGTNDIKDVVKRSKQLRLDLSKHRKDPAALAGDKKLLLAVKQLKTLVEASKRHIEKEYQQKVELQKAKMSMVETMIKDRSEIRTAASDRLTKDTERKDKNAEAMRQSKRELADIMGKMNNLDLTKVDMDGAIKCLEEGLSYLGKVEQHWTKLAMFFDTINLIVANNLKNSIDNFIEQANDDVRVGRLIKPAFVASGLCVQVCNAASIYTDVSRQFVMPIISGIAQNLALSKDAKKNTLQLENHETNEKVHALIDSKTAEYADKFEEQMLKQQERLQLSLKDSA